MSPLLPARAAGFAAVALLTPAVAAAAPLKPITGTLDKPGYTVIAMGANGAAATAVAPTGVFSIVPPATPVTLHLRAPDGAYAGPILPREKVDRVTTATAAVAAATRNHNTAKRTVATAKRAVATAKRAVARDQRARKRARSTTARRRAATRLAKSRARLRRATARLRKANHDLEVRKAKLTAAKAQLALAQREAAARVTRAVVGINAGAGLGAISIDAAGGYAVAGTLSAAAWKTGIDPTRTAQASNGVPLGAGNFGLVRSTETTGRTVGDTDLDGVPNALDIDDDGDLVIDDYDTSTTARAAQTGHTQFTDGSHLQVATALGAFDPTQTLNADGGSTDEQIFASERRQGVLEFLWTGLDDGSGEIDCGTLTYCSTGGTGAFGLNSIPPQGSRDDVQPFPGAFDTDGDGFGSLVQGGPSPAMPAAGGHSMGIYHGATAEELQTGDVLIEHGTVGGVPQESATTVGFVFASYAALAAYDDGQGDSGSFTYPSSGSAIPVRAGPSGDVVLRLTFWRPQRLRLADEPGTGRWMDVGNLAYAMYGGGGTMHPNCQQSDLSDPSDTLRASASSPMPGQDSLSGGFQDVSGDQPASAANTFSFTLNLSACLAHTGATFAVGNTRTTAVTAIASGRDGNLFFTSSWINLQRVG